MIINGSATVRRFILEPSDETLPDHLVNVGIKRYCYRPIDDERGEKESMGWVNAFDLINGRIEVSDLLVCDEVMVLGVRKDRKTVSPAIARSKKKEAIEAMKKAKGIERLTRQHRLAVEEEVTKQLLQETSPSTSLVDLAWMRRRNILFMGTTGSGSERIADIFEGTFNVRPRPAFPGYLAWLMGPERAEGQFAPAMAFLELVERGACYGEDFLTWLMVHSVAGDLGEHLPQGLGARVEVAGHIALCSREGKKIKMDGDECASRPEIPGLLADGHRVCSMKMNLTESDNLWTGTVDAGFDVKGLKLPVPKVVDEQEFANLRADALAHFFEVFDGMFKAFLDVRNDEVRWAEEVAGWVKD